MAAESVLAVRRVKAIEEQGRQLKELNRKVALIMAHLGIDETVPTVEEPTPPPPPSVPAPAVVTEPEPAAAENATAEEGKAGEGEKAAPAQPGEKIAKAAKKSA